MRTFREIINDKEDDLKNCQDSLIEEYELHINKLMSDIEHLESIRAYYKTREENEANALKDLGLI